MSKTQIPASVSYRLTIAYGPRRITAMGKFFDISTGDSIPAIERVITQGPVIIGREIVAIISDAIELSRFQQFLRDDGVIIVDPNTPF